MICDEQEEEQDGNNKIYDNAKICKEYQTLLLIPPPHAASECLGIFTLEILAKDFPDIGKQKPPTWQHRVGFCFSQAHHVVCTSHHVLAIEEQS